MHNCESDRSDRNRLRRRESFLSLKEPNGAPPPASSHTHDWSAAVRAPFHAQLDLLNERVNTFALDTMSIQVYAVRTWGHICPVFWSATKVVLYANIADGFHHSV